MAQWTSHSGAANDNSSFEGMRENPTLGSEEYFTLHCTERVIQGIFNSLEPSNKR